MPKDLATTRLFGSDRAPWSLGAVLLVGGLVVLALGLASVLVAEGPTPLRIALLALAVALIAIAVWLRYRVLSARRRFDEARDDEFAEVRHRLDLAMEASRIGFWEVDLRSDTLRWDMRACQHMGVEFRDGGYFTEADWLGAVHPDDRSRAANGAETAIATGGRFISDYRVVWPTGEIRHLRDMAAFYRGNDGTPRLVGLIWDVTADKEREAELEVRRREAEAANKTKSSFLAAMSHEIRTPLAGVIGMMELMQGDALSTEQAERARIASASAQSLLQLLNDVLDLSKLEAAAAILAPVPIEVRRLVDEVADLMAARAAQQGLFFTCRVDEDVPHWVMLDPVRFRQILTNIVSNALSYTDAGYVSIRVRQRSGDARGLEVVVSDSGIGISEADTVRIFDRFVQAEGSAKRQSGGTGLGLAIARELVELMQGRISVESRLGSGSTFTFSVRAEPCAAPAPVALARAHEAPSPPPLDILVAEDNATNRFLIGSLLRKGGHRVTIVGNGREAVEALSRARFDVVLMDVQMPVMDGLAAARAIRAADFPHRDVPIVALTASVLSDDRERYTAAGMDECLPKPLDTAALHAVLSRVARRLPATGRDAAAASGMARAADAAPAQRPTAGPPPPA